ncbi:MAG: hypothetical protein K0Q87_5329 [Neobacillus sp.]|jgi:hypothetical protein|nr:hypothetical protein [Neobacillus sp.]
MKTILQTVFMIFLHEIQINQKNDTCCVQVRIILNSNHTYFVEKRLKFMMQIIDYFLVYILSRDLHKI